MLSTEPRTQDSTSRSGVGGVWKGSCALVAGSSSELGRHEARGACSSGPRWRGGLVLSLRPMFVHSFGQMSVCLGQVQQETDRG